MLTCCFGNILIWSPHVDIETGWHKTNILDFVPSILKLSLSWLRGSVWRRKGIWMIKGDFSNEWNCQLIVFKLFNSSMNQMPLCWWRVASCGWIHSNGNESWANNPVKTGGLPRQNIDGMTKVTRSKKLTTEKTRVEWTKDLMINWKWSTDWCIRRDTEQRTAIIARPRKSFF